MLVGTHCTATQISDYVFTLLVYFYFKYVSFSPIKKVSQWEKPLWDPSTEEKNKIRREYLKQKYNMKI